MREDKKLKKLGIFRAATATELGFTNTDLIRLAGSGVLTQVDRGIYQHSDHFIDPNTLDFVIAQVRFGNQVAVAGLSALFYYNMTENIPNKVWLLVPSEKRTTDPKYRFLRTNLNLDFGIVQEKGFRITNIERTLVEAFNYSSKVGLDTAMLATAKAFKKEKTTLKKVLHLAKQMKLESVLNKHWEALNGLQGAV